EAAVVCALVLLVAGERRGAQRGQPDDLVGGGQAILRVARQRIGGDAGDGAVVLGERQGNRGAAHPGVQERVRQAAQILAEAAANSRLTIAKNVPSKAYADCRRELRSLIDAMLKRNERVVV